MSNLIDNTKSLVTNAKQGTYTYSELFHSIQGEGAYTGRNTLWLRFFGCNLQCSGFGQKYPTRPETWELPYKDFDATKVNRVEDLPVFERGCDTPYSWSAKFKHLMHHHTAAEIAEKLYIKITNEHNILGQFCPDGREIDLCFTGGEPLLAHNQNAIIDIVDTLIENGNFPKRLSVETNSTQMLTEELRSKINEWRREHNIIFFFSCSPKLWTVAGELPEKAFKPDVIRSYQDASRHGQLKFVATGTEECWGELEHNIAVLQGHRYNVLDYPVYIMKVGATVEGQAGELPGHDISEPKFVEEVLRRGYHYSGRIHVGIWGNVVGS